MSLAPGTRFGSYKVAEAIGAGGMGEVYRATDTTLERDVALKVLPASFAEDADRVTRFEREARTLAALNHPNIAQIYGLEKSDGTTALVMELVDGPTLEERIAKGPISADEALGIAMQIADALEVAHGQNIVHRDLKPANIKLKADGTVKVLDFGIAKALAPEALTSDPQSPIMTTPATQVGVILGTAAYMSPEQAKGKAIDQRTDIWAFGCVLYEMLTGQLAFGAEDVPTTLARIIANDTNLDSLPGAISPAVRHTIKLCLQKDVRERVADIRDVKLALAGSFEAELPSGVESAQVLQSPRRLALPVAASVVLTAVAAGVAAWALWPAPAPLPVSRFEHTLPEGQTFWRAGRSLLAVSPDGSTLVYNAVGGLYLRNLDELEANLISGTETDLDNPFFSPDGQTVAYWDARTELRRIAISGGTPVTITDDVSNPLGASWSPDGTIVYGQPAGIYRVSANGGEPELIVPSDGEDSLYGPQLLPGSNAVLFTLTPNRSPWDSGHIVVQSLLTGERTVLVEGASDARYLPSGYLIYARANTLFAARFDLDTLSVSSSAVPVVRETMRANAGQTPVAHFDVAANGTLVYAHGASGGIGRTLVWLDRAGNEEPLAVPPGGYAYPRISPDGTRIALDERATDDAIWIWDIQTETRTRLTVPDLGARNPAWTPDSQRIAYAPTRAQDQDIAWKAANNTGQTEILAADAVDASSTIPLLNFFSASGSELVITANARPTSNNSWDIGLINVDAPAETVWLLDEPHDESTPALSPDGHWMAYESSESGVIEIYVRPFPNVDDDSIPVSSGGGYKPLWSPDGRELFYTNGNELELWSVTVDATETEFSFSDRAKVMDWPYLAGGFTGRTYDVSPVDGRLLAIAERPGLERARIIIVENWTEELERLVPTE